MATATTPTEVGGLTEQVIYLRDTAGLSRSDRDMLTDVCNTLSAYRNTLSAYRKRLDADQTQVKHMVDRFLSWPLPENFMPDGGISFDPVVNAGTKYAGPREPVGTNLFDATQAEAMVRHMLGEGK